MKKIDRYIIWKYLSTFFFVALIFSMVSMVIDFSEKVESFIAEPVTLYEILFEYYLTFLLWINGLLWPLFAMIAVIFFTSRMAYNSEIISILGAGISFRRLLLPYMIGAGIITLMLLFGDHYLIPVANKYKLDFERTYIWKHNDKGKTKDVHMFIGPGEKVYVRFYKKLDSSAVDFRWEKFEDNQLAFMLKARTAEWIGPPNNWRLKNYEIRTFNGMEETIELGKGQSIDTSFNLRPSDFVRYLNQKEMMSTPALQQFIAEEQQKGIANTLVYEIEIHRRTADPFTIIILTVLGVSVASRKVRGGTGLHLAMGIILGALFIFCSRFSVTFATKQSIPAALGVWIPNIIFSLIALYTMARAQK